MTIEEVAIAGTQWLWSKYGKDIVDKAFANLTQSWQKFKWSDAEIIYRSRILDIYSTTRLLGYPKPINITEIFADVYTLDKQTAFRYYDLLELQKRPMNREHLRTPTGRHKITEIIDSEKRLYILGKPGSGKTTLLKYLVLQCSKGKPNKTPIFVSLREWADSKLDLTSYAALQFDICGFPDANTFLKHLFKSGDGLLLLDALDEVQQNQQQKVIKEIKEFSERYPKIQICITCRIAATSYSFENFTYVEIADFDDSQIEKFLRKWYVKNKALRAKILYEITKIENQDLRELAQTPLLLALLCLAYDELGYFPKNKADLYKETIEVLLKRWDESRLIERDEIYHDLSSKHKKELLTHIAAKYFEKGVYFVDKDDLNKEIARYLALQLGINEKLLDGEIILRAIESQHGLLVERGKNIYSFLHLTFQEYLTALYILENLSSENLAGLVDKRLRDSRWDEIFLIASNILAKQSSTEERNG